uniref:Alpha-defensin propeptide domain-containing protein n=1 Tax=Astatotilapia calliptera TaxID=8154 RepID=A0AAX7TUX2_ASTCA
MKAFSIAVAVTLVLAFICILESSAIPFAGVQEPEEAGSNDTPVVAHQEMSAESSMSTLVYRADGVEHLAHVFCLSHRCQITSGKSVRAIFPCAAGAAIAAEATRAAASAASSEDSRNSHKILIYYAY